MNKHWLDEVLEKSQERLNSLPIWLRECAIRQELQRRAEVETPYMSIWEELKEKGYNPTIKIKKNPTTFTVCISVEKEYEVTETSAINAAIATEKLFWKDIKDRNAPVFNYNVYIKYPVHEDEEDYLHCGEFNSDELDPNNYD